MSRGIPEDEPGAVIIVSRGGEVLFREAYGQASLELGVRLDAEHAFCIASVTAPLTATAVMVLVEDGALSLDDATAERLGGIDLDPPVTIRHLLSHDSRLPDLFDVEAYGADAQHAAVTPEALFAAADGALRSGTLLKPETVRLMEEAYALPDGQAGEHGMGWSITERRGMRFFHHGGGINGWRAYIVAVPEQEVFVAVLSNREGERTPVASKHLDTLVPRRNLGVILIQQRRGAEAVATRTLERQREVLGPEHPQTMGNVDLSEVYRRTGRLEESEEIMVEAVAAARARLGDEHPNTLGAIVDLGTIRLVRGRHAEVIQELEPTLVTMREAEGIPDPWLCNALLMLGTATLNSGDVAGVRPLAIEGLELGRRLHAEGSSTLVALLTLALESYRQGGELELALPLAEELGAVRLRVLGPSHPETIQTLQTLQATAGLQQYLGRPTEAAATYAAILPGLRAVRGLESTQTLAATTDLGNLYVALGRHEEGLELLEISRPVKDRVVGPHHPWTGLAIRGLVDANLALGRMDEAERRLDEYMAHLEPFLQIAETERAGEIPPVIFLSAAWALSRPIDSRQDPPRSRAYAERALEGLLANPAPGQWGYLFSLSQAQFMAGDTTTAVATLRQAIELQDGAPDVRMANLLAEYEAAVAGGG